MQSLANKTRYELLMNSRLPAGTTFSSRPRSTIGLLGGGVAEYSGGKNDGEPVTEKLKAGQTALVTLHPGIKPSFDCMLGVHPDFVGKASVVHPGLLVVGERSDLAIAVTAIKELDLASFPWMLSIVMTSGAS